jgi:hypothetical protein
MENAQTAAGLMILKITNLILQHQKSRIYLKAHSTFRLEKMRQEKRAKQKEKKMQEVQSRKHLQELRVIQKNLVYVTNLPLGFAKEEVTKNRTFIN